ncbi:MAG TPA: cyclic 2,3-diphosphoglycerate synthase [Candidatus Dormibacteraeota bacterium]|nr:cyclic 2,3-diphosphoglycerate synthase [Candidatus Dormibacteraeota bacterium]
MPRVRRARRVVIMGAGGRDFHNFNTFFKTNPHYEVVAFTASAQIPGIDDRRYPRSLAGKLYPKGIPIFSEQELPKIVRERDVDVAVFAYSDVSHEYVMHKASWVFSLGCDFMLMGPKSTQLKSKVPVVAVTAVRTGSGKSQTTRKVCEVLKKMAKRVVVIRHPMPYGELSRQGVQRFASYADLERHHCTIEEREEYEPHLDRGTIVYAGVDYAEILSAAEKEADVIVWDGGNNDFSFYRPDLQIVVADPHRPGHERRYHPGETNLRLAHVVVINKETTTDYANIEVVRTSIQQVNPDAIVIDAASPISVDKPELIRDRRALVIEDGPTLTHGEMKYGAGVIAAKRYGAREIVDPRPWLVGEIRDTFRQYPAIGALLPAMGYSKEQIQDMETTINACECDVVIVATPIDLRRLVKIRKPAVRVGYELEEIGRPKLEDVIGDLLARLARGRGAPAAERVSGRRAEKPVSGRRAAKRGLRRAARKAGGKRAPTRRGR